MRITDVDNATGRGALRFCRARGCRDLIIGGSDYCRRHSRLAEMPIRPSGSRRNPHGAAWDAARVRIARRDGFACQQCGRAIAEYRSGQLRITGHLHHVRARGAGGGDEDDNLSMLCQRCHCRESLAEARAGLTAAWRRNAPRGMVIPPVIRSPESSEPPRKG